MTGIIPLLLFLILLRGVDAAAKAMKERRDERRLESAHRRRLEIAEKTGDMAALLITDRELAGAVYDQLEAKLEAEKTEGEKEIPKLANGG